MSNGPNTKKTNLVSSSDFIAIPKGLKVYSKSVAKGYSTPKVVADKLKTFDCLNIQNPRIRMSNGPNTRK
ncbi:hypothetical protein MASR2M44_18510 [Bacteroidota bacterium]